MNDCVFMLKLQPRIVLIGGTGMVGTVLQDQLKKDKTDFVLVGRDVANYNFLKDKIKPGDIVYYLATENKSSKWEDFYKVNAVGVKNIVKICKKISVAKLIYVSTVMVFDKDGIVRKNNTGNFYIDSKVMGLKYIKNNLDKNFYIVYPGVVLYRDFRYKKQIRTTIDKIKNYLGFFTQGGLMMMVGSNKRKFKYIYIDELVERLLNLDNHKEVMAVTGEMTVRQYIGLASKRTRFWSFRIPSVITKIRNLFYKNKLILE